MSCRRLPFAYGWILLGVAVVASAQQAALAPPDQRISDESIYADHATYQATQDRIEALNSAGRPVRDYHLAKAQCWLDVSFHEYSRNDRSDFPQAALDQSGQLLTAMEQGTEPLPNETPLVNNARRLREDLWQRLGAIHGTPGFTCAQQAVACGEVELVHAGNEFNQQQWRHAKPYIQMAEDLTNQAEALARGCTPEPQNLELSAHLEFDFDRDTLAHLRPDSRQRIDAMMQRARDEQLNIVMIHLTGHADRLQGPNAQYNQALSERRAKTVRDYLVQLGVPAERIQYDWRGDSEPVQACDDLHGERLRECLLPNRRVEVKATVQRGGDAASPP
ncbi:MAG TPA: OmpA family protein [Pseudoxanthomonas sp.]|nr:OmpA family protein [Pseudoxanthomonas sp.]